MRWTTIRNGDKEILSTLFKFFQHYFSQEREVAKKRKEMITPKSQDEVAFADLERALSSGVSLRDEG